MLSHSLATLAFIFLAQSIQPPQLAGGEIEEALAREVDQRITSSKKPEDLELCVADALTERSLMPSAFNGPKGSTVIVNERHSVTIVPTESGSEIEIRARGNADDRLATAISSCS